jgi:hypothetical protein
MNGIELRDRLREKREIMNGAHATRLHRAVSWLVCAEKYEDSDDDLSFISLWISLNSSYAIDDANQEKYEREGFEIFAHRLVALDKKERIYNCLWLNYSSFVRLLIDNQFVFGPFWRSQREGDKGWEKKFEYSKKKAHSALANSEVEVLLGIVMDRLYVLRNQLVHGGATYQSRVNRDQVQNGKRMLLELVPVFIELMFEQEQDWGEIYYPVID